MREGESKNGRMERMERMEEWKGRMRGMKRVRVFKNRPELLVKDINNLVCLLTFQNR